MTSIIGPIVNALVASLIMWAVPAEYVTTALVIVCYGVGYLDGRITDLFKET